MFSLKEKTQWNHRAAVLLMSLCPSVCVLAVHYAAPAQPAALRVRVRPDGPPGCGDDAQHGETHPADDTVHRLLQEHIHSPWQPSPVYAGLHPGRASETDSVLGNRTQCDLQVDSQHITGCLFCQSVWGDRAWRCGRRLWWFYFNENLGHLATIVGHMKT